MTKLQLALDGELATALEILQAVHAFIDIAEIGTPLVFREGMQALRQIRSSYAKPVSDSGSQDYGCGRSGS